MKLFVFLLFMFAFSTSYGQTIAKDTDKIIRKPVIEKDPSFRGGIEKFMKFIQMKVQYPEVTQLIGINGKVDIRFTIGKDGTLKNIHAIDSIGAGCEAAAVQVISISPPWVPGSIDGVPVEVEYSVSVAFSEPKDKVVLEELRKSDYGFLFEIKGSIHSLDEAEAILGKSFPSEQIKIALPYPNNHLTGKKDTYLIKIKAP